VKGKKERPRREKKGRGVISKAEKEKPFAEAEAYK